MRKLTTKEFVEKARAIHGDKYDYSKVEYINAKSKVIIICPEHGEFEQAAGGHLQGKGCPKCAGGGTGLTTEDFINKAKTVHGDKYDYSKVEYVNTHQEVCIICPEHGEFMQEPANHLSGRGCPKCADINRIKSKRVPFEEFFEKAREVHGDKYTYLKDTYLGTRAKMTIVCPIHGNFEQSPSRHILGAGCPKCAGKGLTTNEYVEKAKVVHGDKYDYSKIEYLGSSTKICVVCPEHGEFMTRPVNFLRGHGCPKCAGREIFSTEDFIKKAKEIHCDKYDYSKVKYVNNATRVCIICPEHGEFMQTPANHLKGNGCPKCAGREIFSIEDFIKKSREIHGDKYDYSKVKYVNAKSNVTIICPKHGEFEQVAFNHAHGSGCPKCWYDEMSKSRALTRNEFITKAREVHGNKYDYSKVEYVNAQTSVCIVCPEHGEFMQAPNRHLRGQGCPQCNRPSYMLRENKLKLLTEYDLENMSHHQLMELISVNALPGDFKKLVFSESGSEKRKDTIKELQKLYEDPELSEDEAEDTIEHSIEDEEKKYEEEHTESTKSTISNYTVADTTETKLDAEVLPSDDDNLVAELIGYDRFSKQLVTYGEKNKFLSEVEIQKIWNIVLREDSSSSKELINRLLEQRETSSEWLSNIIDEFMKEYDRVQGITQDKDYKFKYAPSLMQKLMVYRLIENDSYLNLCGTGAGKTNAFLMASRAIGAKYSVIICPNSVVDTWEKSIKAIYPTIHTVKYQSASDLKSINRAESAYIIINYDKFSNGSMCTKDKMDKFVDVVCPQFVCFDELHNAKAANEDASLRNENLRYFRQKASETYREGFKTLGMTATPLINNLNEVRSLLELVTGKEFNEIGNRNTIENIHLAYKNLLLYGFRFVPNYGINVVNTELDIDGAHLKDSLLNLKNSDVNTIEGSFVNDKMEAVRGDLTQGTIVYTTFIEKIVPKIEKKLKEFGITYARYTGKETAEERSSILDAFADKKFEVLVASSPITTGVDGLQKFCNKMVLISLPWTNAEYTQLVGRINRQGGVFDEVNIIFPRINIELENGKVWSWDNKRRNIILKKKTLSDAVVDGIFTYAANIDRNRLLKGAIEALRSGEATEDFELNREDITSNPKVVETSREYSESVVNKMHAWANTSKSSTVHTRLTENPSWWHEYHNARESRMSEWVEDPKDVIAEMINKGNNYGVIADLGCGLNKLKDKITASYTNWLSFDHIAQDDSVIAADTTNLSEYVYDESLDVTIYCESLWGINTDDYFKEASRMLKRGGVMYVAEPVDKFSAGSLAGVAAAFGLEIAFEDCEKRYSINYLKFIKK